MALQLLENGLSMVIDTIGKLLGTDPNQEVSESMGKLTAQIKNLTETIRSILKVILGTELGDDLHDQVMDAVQQILAPAFTKAAAIFNNFLAKEEGAAVGLAANLAEDVAYPIVAPIRTILSTLEILDNSLVAFAEATGLLKDEIGTFQHIKSQITDTVSKIGEVAERSKEMNIVPTAEPNAAQIPQVEPPAQQGGAATRKIKRLHKDAIKIGGRIQQSRLEFLSPHLMASKKRSRRMRKR
jgi:DNA-binding ferritin-like protein